MKNIFLQDLLKKIGLTPPQQEEVLKSYEKLIYIVVLSTLKDFLPKEKVKQLATKVQFPGDWVKVISVEAKNIEDKEGLFHTLNERLEKETENFFQILASECPDDKKREVQEYLSEFPLTEN
jgi:hypothetical protein